MTAEFHTVFNSAGGCSLECTCGRTHFGDRGHWTWNEGEYEHLEQMAKEKPDQYVYHEGFDGVSSMEVPGGSIYVEDCPCNYGEWLEDWLWHNSTYITAYLKARALRLSQGLAETAFGASSAAEALAQFHVLQDEAERRTDDACYRLTGKPPP